MDLIADIGATNSRCALVDDSGRVTRSDNYRNADFDGLEAVLAHFVSGAENSTPERAALAIAAPLAGDEVAMTNIGWRFSRSGLEQALGLKALHLVNDFEALAHALPLIGPADCHLVGGGRALPGAAMAVLGPGSGLGVASVVADEGGWTPVAGEGGHVSVPAMSSIETELIRDHGESNGHCSAETLLSGPGLVRIYATLSRLHGGATDELTPAAISDAAIAGDELAGQTCDVFFAILGTIAGNLALTVGARGGVFIAGGIVPRMLERFERSAFRERFVAKGRYRAYLDAVPTAVITRPNPAFVGLAAVLARSRAG